MRETASSYSQSVVDKTLTQWLTSIRRYGEPFSVHDLQHIRDLFDLIPLMDFRTACIHGMKNLDDATIAWFRERIPQVYEVDRERGRDLGYQMINRYLFALEDGDPRLIEAIDFAIRQSRGYGWTSREIDKALTSRLMGAPKAYEEANARGLLDGDLYYSTLDPAWLGNDWPSKERALKLLIQMKDTRQLARVESLARKVREESKRVPNRPVENGHDPFFYVRALAVINETLRVLREAGST